MTNHLLSVEIDEASEQVFIHGSPAGLRFLARHIESIAATAEGAGHAHDHFMSEAWGGKELSGHLQGGKESHALINHLIIYGRAAP